MKRLILIITAIIIMVPALCQAQVCAPANTINLNMVPPALRLTTIQNEITGYAAHPEPGGNYYEVCFQMDELEITAMGFDAIKIKVNQALDKDIYIVGLKLTVDANDPVGTGLFGVYNDSSHKIILKDFEFKNVKKGISMYGKASEIRSSIIEGDDSGADACIEVLAIDSVLNDVELSKCKEGVLVQEGQLKIENSTIRQNKLGVLIKTGVEGTDIISSKIYANDDDNAQTEMKDDGVRIEGGVAHATAFYDVVNGEAVPVAEGEEVIDYEDRTPYILVPLPPGETDPAKMEFYLSNETDCSLPPLIYSMNQTCGLVEIEGSPMRIDIDAAALEQGPVSVQLPLEKKNMNLVTMYSDPELGTAGISRRFKVGDTADGIVTFVSTPYDIPTTGGVSDGAEIASGADTTDDIEVEDTGSTGATTGGLGGEGSGSSIASAGSCGGGASLARDSFRSIVVGMNLWWILLVLGLALGANLVRARSKRRRRHRR